MNLSYLKAVPFATLKKYPPKCIDHLLHEAINRHMVAHDHKPSMLYLSSDIRKLVPGDYLVGQFGSIPFMEVPQLPKGTVLTKG